MAIERISLSDPVASDIMESLDPHHWMLIFEEHKHKDHSTGHSFFTNLLIVWNVLA